MDPLVRHLAWNVLSCQAHHFRKTSVPGFDLSKECKKFTRWENSGARTHYSGGGTISCDSINGVRSILTGGRWKCIVMCLKDREYPKKPRLFLGPSCVHYRWWIHAAGNAFPVSPQLHKGWQSRVGCPSPPRERWQSRVRVTLIGCMALHCEMVVTREESGFLVLEGFPQLRV